MLIYQEPYSRKTESLGVTLTRNNERGYILDVETMKNAPETLYRLAAVLYIHDWNIIQADIKTLGNDEIKDTFLIRPLAEPEGMDELKFEKMMVDFEKLLFEGRSVLSYLQAQRKKTAPERTGNSRVDVDYKSSPTILTISGFDRPGYLLSLCQIFSLMEISIQTANIHTGQNGEVENQFYLPISELRFDDMLFRERFCGAIQTIT